MKSRYGLLFISALIVVVALFGLDRPTLTSAQVPFSPPTNPRTVLLGGNVTRFQWDRGVDNQWFCVDTAFTFDDLVNLRGSWANWGCGTTGTILDVAGLRCGTGHFFRVYAQGTNSSGYSSAASFTTESCNFTPPSNPRSIVFSNAVRVQWDRGVDNQFFCVDTAFSQDDLLNRNGSWTNWGCGTTATTLDLLGLQCGALHYWRVWAQGTATSGNSPVATFITAACNVAFTPPTNPQSSEIAATSARVTWTAGADNRFFCVDTALSQAELLSFTGSWRNWGCGTTSTTLVLSGLQCNTTYNWRVWAQGSGTSGYSAIATFTTAACAFSPPTNLRFEALSMTSIRFRWDAGSDNQWFCLDKALTQSDLQNFTGSWSNHACGTTATVLTLTGLTCGTTYYWRVYAQGTTVAGYSAIAQAQTLAC